MGLVTEYRGEVPSLELLNQLVAEPLPLGLRAGAVETAFYRDVYFDASDWTLRRRRVTCRFRISVDDRRILTLRIYGSPEGGLSLISPQVFEAELPELDPVSALAGTSEPARRLRALIEPSLLSPRVEFETERRIRRSRPGWFSRGEYALCYDVVTVRGHGLAQTFQEIKVRRLRTGRPTLERLVKAFQDQYGLRPLLVSKLERAEKVLREIESEGLARGVQASREVAVVVLEQGCIALRHERDTLGVPVRAGSGEEGCRYVLRTNFGSADGQVRLLGTAPAVPGRPLLEVWLARRLGKGFRAVEGTDLRWVPLQEVVARVGSPALQEPRTLAALTVASRSDLVPEWPTGPTELAVREGSDAPVPVGTITREWTIAGLRESARRSAAEESSRALPNQFLNSELSWLEFNARVLALAEDRSVPLLGRVRFLSIFSANLDEFFMVRIGALKRAVAAGDTARSDDGLTAEEQLGAIFIRLRPLLERQARCLADVCLPELAAHGIRMLRWSELSDAQRASLRRYFVDQIFPLLTPQAITRAPGHPFPLIANLRLSLAVLVRGAHTGPVHFAYVKLPERVPRFVPVAGGREVVPLEDVVRGNLDLVYPGRQVDAAHAFRVTRSGELEVDERRAENLLQVIQEEAKRRPYGAVVRFEVERAMPREMRQLLLRELQFEEAGQVSTLGHADFFEVDGLMELQALREIADLARPDLQYPPFQGRRPIGEGRSLFRVLAEHDLLVYHPHDSFEDTVERFFVEAAGDPDVLAIKLTLYRAGGRSGIVDALVRAAAAGKEVFVFVELKARFDEERNIEWAKKLEQAGIHVVYGLVEVKTHAKIGLVVRREGDVVRRYVHIGTGNYNAVTAAVYTDLGLLTSAEACGADLNDLFNELSGSSRLPQTPFRRLLVAPTHMLQRFIELIDREADHARAGRGGRIRVKINGLADAEVIQALYRASQAGVEIDLIVRGICCLRPGVPGLSEGIRIISILGRFLEHARIFWFGNGGEPEYYIGSADWRARNLRRRIEVVAPVLDPACRARLDQILETELADPTAWELGPDGGYYRRTPESGGNVQSAQEWLMSIEQ